MFMSYILTSKYETNAKERNLPYLSKILNSFKIEVVKIKETILH